MKIENIKIVDLKKYELNAKLHPDSQIEGLANSIKKFGFVQPIVISKENEIIIGHARYEAAKKLDLDKVPCVRAEKLTEDQVKALRLIDNRIAETGWDINFLKQDLEGFEFDFEEFNLDFSFDEKKIENKKEKQIEDKIEYLVIVECENEIDQKQIFEEFLERKYKCKLMM